MNQASDVEKVVREFVDAVLTRTARRGLAIGVGVEAQLRDPTREPNGEWLPWRPIPSTLTDDELRGLAADVGSALPPAYGALLRYVHFFALEADPVAFRRHQPQSWRAELEHESMLEVPDADGQPRTLKSLGLFPMGHIDDLGPVCLDLNAMGSDGDCPVVVCDRDSGERTMLASSSFGLFAILHALATDCVFVQWDDDDDLEDDDDEEIGVADQTINMDTWLDEQLERFAKLDPALRTNDVTRALWRRRLLG